MLDTKKIVIKRVIMAGKGPKYTYRLELNSQVLFQKESGSHLAWTRKKDAKAIINAIEIHGIDYVQSELKFKLFYN